MDDPVGILEQTEMRRCILSEDGTLKYDFMTSLQKIAMARVVCSLWMNPSTQQCIMDLYRDPKYADGCSFFDIEQNILSKIPQLSLPKSLCEELKYLVLLLGKTLLNWIQYHDEHILSPKESGYSAVDLIHNITWTARGKIDLVQTAKNILTNSNICLSDDHKYKLACTYCLEDEIAIISSKLVNKLHLSHIMIDQHPMVYFWSAHITGDWTQINNPPYYNDRNRRAADRSINEHIIQLLIKHDLTITDKTINDIPIRFMWNKLSKEEKAKNIALIFRRVNNIDFIISSLSNLDYEQQQNILRECSYKILNVISDDWWWGKYFLETLIHVFDIMNPPSVWRVLRMINEKKRKSSNREMYNNFKSLFMQLWQKCSAEVKEFIFHDNTYSLLQFVYSALDWEQDRDLRESILKEKREYFFF